MIKTPQYYEITRLARQHRFDEARRQLKADHVLLTESERRELLGNIAFYEGNRQEAIRLYEAAMRSDEKYDCARYQYVVGVNEERRGNSVEASDRYNGAIAIEPT